MTAETLTFLTRADFRAWLATNASSSGGVWLMLSKDKSVKTLSAKEALEEALCFGWIDSQLKSVDEQTYRKYFSPRRPKTEWSAVNIGLVEMLENQGLMTDLGRAKVLDAKRSGHFQRRERAPVAQEQVDAFIEKVKGHEIAYQNLMKMPPSVKRTYTAYSMDVKSEESARKRLEKIIERLNQNLKPM